MVSVIALWLPILLAGVLVFVASAVIHMVLGYHGSDHRRVPGEGRVMTALREVGLAPGEYAVPHPGSSAGLKDPAYLEKVEQGPVVFLTVAPSGPPGMGRQLAQWFLFTLVVGVFAAYVTGRAVGPGGEYLEVFRFAGTTAFVGYALALWSQSIWFHRPLGTTLKFTLDGAIYALLTAGAFGWLWPS